MGCCAATKEGADSAAFENNRDRNAEARKERGKLEPVLFRQLPPFVRCVHHDVAKIGIEAADRLSAISEVGRNLALKDAWSVTHGHLNRNRWRSRGDSLV